MKLNRIYQLKVQLEDGGTAIIQPPMTIEFNIDRNTQASSNTANIKIYNLSEKTRALIFRDRYQFWDPSSAAGPNNRPRNVQLFAGYEWEAQNLSLIFNGQMYVGYSQRRGPEWVTTIEAFDAAINAYTAVSARTLEAGVSKQSIIKELYKDFVDAAPGIVGNFNETSKRRTVLVGPTIKLLADITNDNFYFDLGRPIALKKNEYFKNDTMPELNSDTGLLNSPLKANAMITVPLLFTPGLQVGQKVSVNAIEKQYNGEWKVVGIRHSGIISGTHNGQTTTTASLFNGAEMVEVPGAGE